MNIRKVIQRRIRRREGGVDLAADVNAVVAANIGERGSSTHVSSSQRSTAETGDTGGERQDDSDPRRPTE